MSTSLLQTPIWAQHKSLGGWQPNEVAGTLVLSRNLPLKLFMAYAPEVSDKNWTDWLPQFTEEMRRLAQENHLTFARLEILEPIENQALVNLLKQNGYRKSFEEVQPEYRQIIDIASTEPEILSQMKPKGRYNIKIAQKHGIKITFHDDPSTFKQDAQIFYDLMQQTGSRNRFSIRPLSYFQNLLKTLYESQAGFTIKASYQNQPLASLIISCYDGVATYLYGASSSEHREAMAPYLAHWFTIQEAKKRQCHTYDLLAIAPPDKPRHKHAQLSRFKQQFGGRSVQLIGSWDLLFHPFWYTIFRLAEKYRRHI